MLPGRGHLSCSSFETYRATAFLLPWPAKTLALKQRWLLVLEAPTVVLVCRLGSVLLLLSLLLSERLCWSGIHSGTLREMRKAQGISHSCS